MATWTASVDDVVGSSCFFDTASNACWFATNDGTIRTFRILGQQSRALGDGWIDVAAVLPSIDGLNMFVITRAGEIFVAPRGSGGRASAIQVVDLGSTVTDAKRLTNDDLLLLGTSGKVTLCDPVTATLTELASLPGAVALATNDSEALVATATDIHRFQLTDGTAVGSPLPAPATLTGPITCIVDNAGGVTVSDDSGAVVRVDWAGNVDTFALALPSTTSLCRWHSLVIVAAASTLNLTEWGDDVETLPVSAGLDPLVPGGWTPFNVDYGSIGLSQNDVGWEVAEGQLAATISVARPVDSSANAYEHRVIAGIGAPEFTIVARELSTGTIIATRRFRTVTIWPDTEMGPPVAIVGQQQVYGKPGWGGGPDGPQNINSHPAPEEFRIAVAVFRTKGSTSTINAASRIADLTDNIVGPGRSVVRYYEEVSFRNTPASPNPAHPKGTTVKLLGGQVFGPIDINSSWGDLFAPGNLDDPWSSWNPKGDAWDVLGGEFSTFLLDRGLADSVTRLADAFVLLVLPGTDDPYKVGETTWPAQWNWAFAGDSQIYWKGSSWTTFGRKPSVTMPAGFPTNHPDPWTSDEFMSTICHELGHTLGCADQYAGGDYSAEIGDRYVTGWDLMDDDVPLSHFALPHRMRLGWISPDWVEVCDFAKNPASRTVTLQAIETVKRSGPDAGRKAGIEIRIRDGWNYYFEYRREQAGAVGDQDMPFVQAVIGTDVNLAKVTEAARPLILMLPNDADGDGPVLRQATRDYKESDTTNPDRMNDFILTRQAAFPFDNNAISVKIEYIGAFRPELQLTPAPGRGNFKSPDIWVDGPAGAGVVVKGKLNRIRINVHNKGSKAADAVQIRVQWLPFTTAPGPWNPLPNPPTQAIPAHATREFSLDWIPPQSIQLGGVEVEHFCVRVDIDRYVDPTDPAGSEIVIFNNWAQSNFTTDRIAHGSPSERRTSLVTATNILERDAFHSTVIEQTSDLFRTYLDHSWRRLEPGQMDTTRLWYESLAGDPIADRDFQEEFRIASQERGLKNDMSARAFLMPDREFDGPRERWGVEMIVQAGIGTRVREAHGRGELVSGSIVTSNDDPVQGGPIRLIAWPKGKPESQLHSDGQLNGQGQFSLGVPPQLVGLAHQGETVLLEVYYHGNARYASCHSKEFMLHTG